MNVVHCDGPGCSGTKQSDRALFNSMSDPGWYTLTNENDHAEDRHFCDLECLANYARSRAGI